MFHNPHPHSSLSSINLRMHHLSLSIAKIITFKSTWMITISIYQEYAMQVDASGIHLLLIYKADFIKKVL